MNAWFVKDLNALDLSRTAACQANPWTFSPAKSCLIYSIQALIPPRATDFHIFCLNTTSFLIVLSELLNDRCLENLPWAPFRLLGLSRLFFELEYLLHAWFSLHSVILQNKMSWSEINKYKLPLVLLELLWLLVSLVITSFGVAHGNPQSHMIVCIV